MTDELATATGDFDVTSRALLQRWRLRRQPEVADALDAASARIARPAIEGRTSAARHATWLALAAAGDAADTPRLLAMLLDGTSADSIAARIAAITAGGPDPRVATALVAIVTTQRHFVSKPKFWRAVLDAIASLGDVRQIAPLRAALPAGVIPRPRMGYRGIPEFRLPEWLVERLPPIIRHLEHVTIADVTADERSVLARIGAPSKQAHTEADLLAAVLATPDDDAPRLVLADALLARDDRRGELIAVQVKRGRDGKVSARENQLVKAHLAAILGPLAPVVSEPELARGFLAKCGASFAEHQRHLVDHPAWGTVEDVATDELHLIRRRDLPALRRITVTDAMSQLLLDGEPIPRIAALAVMMSALVSRNRRIADSDVLPGLTELGIWRRAATHDTTAAAALRPILEGRLGRGVEQVVIRSHDTECPLELDAWRAARLRPRLRFELPYMRARYDGEVLEVELNPPAEWAARCLRTQLGANEHQPRVVVAKAPRNFDPAWL